MQHTPNTHLYGLKMTHLYGLHPGAPGLSLVTIVVTLGLFVVLAAIVTPLAVKRHRATRRVAAPPVTPPHRVSVRT